MEHAVYLKSVKELIKTKKLTYKELAQKIKMSESGVKKMLNAKDISFRRFVQICDVLGTLPGHVLYAAEQKSIPTKSLTTKQQDLLLSNRTLLAVYWRISVENLQLKEISVIQKLNMTELTKALKTLATAGLLIENQGTYHSLHTGKFSWPNDSKIAKALNQEWSKLTLSRVLQTTSKIKKHHRLTAIQLSDKAYENFVLKLSELIDETVRISEREELTLPKKDLHNSTILAAVLRQGVLDPD